MCFESLVSCMHNCPKAIRLIGVYTRLLGSVLRATTVVVQSANKTYVPSTRIRLLLISTCNAYRGRSCMSLESIESVSLPCGRCSRTVGHQLRKSFVGRSWAACTLRRTSHTHFYLSSERSTEYLKSSKFERVGVLVACKYLFKQYSTHC